MLKEAEQVACWNVHNGGHDLCSTLGWSLLPPSGNTTKPLAIQRSWLNGGSCVGRHVCSLSLENLQYMLQKAISQ